MDWYDSDSFLRAVEIALASAGLTWLVGYVNRFHPKRIFEWSRRPDLRVSRDVPESTRAAVVKAWRMLHALEAPIGATNYEGGPIPMDYEIVVTKADAWCQQDHAGRHEVFFEDGSKRRVRRARITLPIMVDSRIAERSALHELLRVLGFSTVRRAGHALTFPTKQQGGNVDGIAEVFRKHGVTLPY